MKQQVKMVITSTTFLILLLCSSCIVPYSENSPPPTTTPPITNTNYGPDVRHVFLTACESAKNREWISLDFAQEKFIKIYDHLWNNLEGNCLFFLECIEEHLTQEEFINYPNFKYPNSVKGMVTCIQQVNERPDWQQEESGI